MRRYAYREARPNKCDINFSNLSLFIAYVRQKGFLMFNCTWDIYFFKYYRIFLVFYKCSRKYSWLKKRKIYWKKIWCTISLLFLAIRPSAIQWSFSSINGYDNEYSRILEMSLYRSSQHMSWKKVTVVQIKLDIELSTLFIIPKNIIHFNQFYWFDFFSASFKQLSTNANADTYYSIVRRQYLRVPSYHLKKW